MNSTDESRKSLRLDGLAGLLITSVMGICFLLLVDIWPDGSSPDTQCILLCHLGPERRLMVITLLAGATGATLHLARSYTYFRGMGTFDRRWSAWYLLRIPMGMALALMFYFVARAGLFTGSSLGGQPSQTEAASANYFGFAALACLAGMFAKQATTKLEETFNAFFGVSEAERTAAPPALLPFETPIKAGAAGDDLEVRIAGSGFTSSSKVMVGGSARGTRFVDATSLTATLLDADVAAPGTLSVIVANGAVRSDPESLEIVA